MALLDLVLQLTGSATLASLMLLCQTLPIFLFTPLAGHVIDRVDRRKLMIVVDLLRIGACLLPLLARTPAMLPFAYAGVILISDRLRVLRAGVAGGAAEHRRGRGARPRRTC